MPDSFHFISDRRIFRYLWSFVHSICELFLPQGFAQGYFLCLFSNSVLHCFLNHSDLLVEIHGSVASLWHSSYVRDVRKKP